MNDDQLDDLKQFIAATVSQSEARTDEKLEQLRKEMLDGFAGVGEAIEEINKQFDARISKLEKQAA